MLATLGCFVLLFNQYANIIHSFILRVSPNDSFSKQTEISKTVHWSILIEKM